MKKFFRKGRKHDGGNIKSAAIEDSDMVNSVDAAVETALEGDREKISSPLVVQDKPSIKIADVADDKDTEANEEATVASTSDESSTIQTHTKAFESVKESVKSVKESLYSAMVPRRTAVKDEDEESYATKAKKAYSCLSGSVYTVATSMDTLLTTCSNTCCLQVEDESQFNSTSMAD
mmetsp:Transcript_6544/g.10996  ORF Transcript_6544/g.10996 Transcript_6544/m.10996 type:complete len:177 (-) Transcript_6544:244-774(-)